MENQRNMEDKKVTKDRYESIRIKNQWCFPLYACSKVIIRQYRKPLEKLGLTYTQYVVMMVLWEDGGMTEGDLGKKVYLDSGTLAPLLKRMEKQGIINRVRPDDNERKLFISLTEKGEAMKEQALDVPKEMNGCIDLPEDELKELKRLLDKAISGMEFVK